MLPQAMIAGGGALIQGGKWLLNKLPAIGAMAKGVQDSVPTFQNEVTVTVEGEPGSAMAELYRLALATAFGLVGNPSIRGVNPLTGTRIFAVPPPGVLMIEYDAADKWVTCTLRYVNSVIVAARGNREDFFRNTAVYSGPNDFVKGDNFNFTGTALNLTPIPGIPVSANSPGVPNLEFAGKVVLTAFGTVPNPDPRVPAGLEQTVLTPNPLPPGDRRGRGVVRGPADPAAKGPDTDLLVDLVFAALSNPGSPELQVFSTLPDGD